MKVIIIGKYAVLQVYLKGFWLKKDAPDQNTVQGQPFVFFQKLLFNIRTRLF